MPTASPGDNPELMAAVQASIDSANEPIPSILPPGPDVTADPPSHGQDPSDAPVPPPGEGAPASTTPAGEPAVPPDSAPKVPESDQPKDPSVTDPANPPLPGEPNPGDAPKETRPSDEFGDMPGNIREETKQRFDKMKSSYDTLHASEQEARGLAQQWQETVASTGATPDQFGAMLGVLKDINAGDPASLRRAFTAIEAEYKNLASVLGVPASGVDPLAAHADLQEKVENGVLEQADALEIAQARADRALNQQYQQTSQNRSAVQTAQERGLDSVRQLGESLRAADPVAFAAKNPLLQPMIKMVVANQPPEKWPGMIQQLYNEIPMPTASVTPIQRVVPNQIRASGAGSMLDKKPSSALEAVTQALGNMG